MINNASFQKKELDGICFLKNETVKSYQKLIQAYKQIY